MYRFQAVQSPNAKIEFIVEKKFLEKLCPGELSGEF